MEFLGVRRSDRRRWKRHSFNVPVRLITETAVIDGRGIRLSEGGMYLFSASNLELGSKIQVDFDGNGRGEASSRAGIVRYRALYLYGVEFLPGEPSDASRAGTILDHSRRAQIPS